MPEARLTKETMTISKKIMPWRPESERKKSSTRRVSAAVINTPAYSGNLGKSLGTGVVSRAPTAESSMSNQTHRFRAIAVPISSARSVAMMAISAQA